MATSRTLSAVLALSLVAVMLAAVSGPPAASGQSPSVPAAGASASASAGSTVGSLATRLPPQGSTAPVDTDSWALAERLAAPTYTADTTAAMREGLARSGIATYADPSSTAPEAPLVAQDSPFRLLDFQAHALAVGAWARSALSGAELDAVVPLPPGVVGMPTTSELLAGYVATADSPGGALSRALMADQDLLDPATARFPGVVLVLFTSDIATDGGRLVVPDPSALPDQSPAADVSRALIAMAVSGSRPATDIGAAAASTGICSDAADWITGTISSLFNALKLATPSNTPGRIIVAIWNWVVDVAHAVVDNLIGLATGYALGTIRSIAASIAAVADHVATFLPYAVRVVATGETGGPIFTLGPDPLPGTFTVTVTAGDLPGWPVVLADCADRLGVPLPDFRARGIPVTWGPLEPTAGALLGPTSSAVTNSRTDDNGQAIWPFLTSTDPGDPTGDQQQQRDAMQVSVIRPEIEDARQRLTAIVFGGIPDLLRPYVTALFAPYLDGLQARLNAILVAHGVGVAVLVYHAPAPPKPSPRVTPTPSATCDHPMPAGSYTGTNTSSETIKNRPSVTRVKTTGPFSLVVAADGLVTGAWSFTSHYVYDAEVSGVKHHHESTSVMTGGTISGTSCDLVVASGTTRFTSCSDSLAGDCMKTATAPGRSTHTGEQHLGSPTSAGAGQYRWHGRHDDPANGLTSSYTISVTSP